METIGKQNIPSAEVVKSIWDLGGLSPKVLAGRVWREIYDGILLTHSAALAFYFLFALFPILLFLITVLGYFTVTGTEMRAELLGALSRIMPSGASLLIYTTIDEISQNAGSGKLSLGLLTGVWVASSGIVAVSEALNAMYGVKEARPWWRVRGMAIVLTFALVVLILTPLIIVLYGGEIGERAASYFNQGEYFMNIWIAAQIPIMLIFVLMAFALIYYLAPNLYEQKWYWITPGSIVGIGLWLLASFLFRVYLRHFDSYSMTYGSLGTVIVLMLWFYLTGVAILIGGKINAEVENAAAKMGIPGAKHHGEKTPEE